MSDLEHDQIEEIRERCRLATPGPWRVADYFDIAEGHASNVLTNSGANALRARVLFEPNRHFENWLADSEFAAHAREDIPALLNEVLSLRAALAASGVEKATPDNAALEAAAKSIYDNRLGKSSTSQKWNQLSDAARSHWIGVAREVIDAFTAVQSLASPAGR